MLAPWKKSYDQPRQLIKKQRHYLLTNICLVKAMVFPVVMYGCENWTLKKAECQRIDAFELWCWKRLLRVPWTARRSNQSILKEISPGYSLEGLMLKLRLQFFGHLIWRTDSFEKTLMVGEGDDRGWMASPTGWTWVWVNSGSWSWTGRPGMLQSMGSQSQTWLTELNWTESVKITFICTWKQKSLCDSLCCCICSLAVVWNWTCHISEVCLYLPAAVNVGVSDSSHSVSNWCSSFMDSPSTPHFLPLLLVVNQWLWGRMEAKLPLLAYAPVLPLKDLGLRCTLTWLNSPPDGFPGSILVSSGANSGINPLHLNLISGSASGDTGLPI